MDYKKKYLKYKLKYLTAKKAFKGGGETTEVEKSPKGTFNYITKKDELINNLFTLIKKHLLWHIETVEKVRSMYGDEETAEEAARLALVEVPNRDIQIVSELKESLKKNNIIFKDVHEKVMGEWINTLHPLAKENMEKMYNEYIKSELMPEEDN